MADENSIYNITEYKDSVTYNKDDIVVVFERFTSFSVPKSAKYYYSTSNSNLDNSPATDSALWGGVTNREGKTKPEFIWSPSYGFTAEHEPRINSIVFGNGYEQRFKDGIYNDLVRFSLTFEHRDIKESRAINHFLKSRNGVESFVFQNIPEPHNDLASAGYRKLFVCKNWSSNFVFYNNYTISATFQEVNN